MESNYNLFEHRHRFAVWAAARATQRGFTNVDKLRDALESSGVMVFVRDHAAAELDAATYAAHHAEWCDKIIESLKHAGVPETTVSFGRAAKLVAVYIKSMVVVGPLAQTALARVAHPPIDRIILRNLSEEPHLPSHVKKKFRETNWTTLDQSEYDSLIRMIQNHVSGLEPFWLLEEYWTVTKNSGD
jgi:hypothetical protein